MNGKLFSEALGEIDGRYIEAAIAYKKKDTSVSRVKGKLSFPLVAAILAILLIGSAVAGAILYGDRWIQRPSGDPVDVVRSALENQADKDYTIRMEIQSVTVDEAETERVVERFIKGVIAERRGWSDEYLDEHFIVVKAVYYAEYDPAKTTRSDGEVTMYFYLAQDVDSGEWTIVDNSGNMNEAVPPTPEVTDAPKGSPAPVGTVKEQLLDYLAELFTKAYSPYYDGLRYESDRYGEYEETIEGDQVTAFVYWTMYHLGKGWDIGTDEGVEQMSNWPLHITVTLREDGALDLETISIVMIDSVNGSVTPVEEIFPTQLTESPTPEVTPAPVETVREQIFDYLSGLFTRAYSPYYDGLHYEIQDDDRYPYEETIDGDQVTATFLWTMYHLGKGWDIGTDEGVEQKSNWSLLVTATIGEDGTLDLETISVLFVESIMGETETFPIEEYFPTQLTE